jgi:hypothetical protein
MSPPQFLLFDCATDPAQMLAKRQPWIQRTPSNETGELQLRT